MHFLFGVPACPPAHRCPRDWKCYWHLALQCTGQSHPMNIFPSKTPTCSLLADRVRPSHGWVIGVCSHTISSEWSHDYPHQLPPITIFFSSEHFSEPEVIYLIVCLCLQNKVLEGSYQGLPRTMPWYTQVHGKYLLNDWMNKWMNVLSESCEYLKKCLKTIHKRK